MNHSQIQQVLRALGLPVSPSTRQSWVVAPCPFAPKTHAAGADRNPSFGVKVDKQSHYYCFSCGVSGDMMDLVLNLKHEKLLGPTADVGAAMQLIADEEESGESELPPAYEDLPVTEATKIVEFPELWLQSFVPVEYAPAAREYLSRRGVSLKTARYLDLRFDSSRYRVCFPIRDWDGRLVGMTGRLIHDGEPRYYYYKWGGHSNELPWYGEVHADPYKPLLIVESVFDYAACLPVYRNILAPRSVGLSRAKVDRIMDFREVVTLFDVGTGGDRARVAFAKHFSGKLLVQLTPPDGYKDPGDMPPGDIARLLEPYLKLDLTGDLSCLS